MNSFEKYPRTAAPAGKTNLGTPRIVGWVLKVSPLSQASAAACTSKPVDATIAQVCLQSSSGSGTWELNLATNTSAAWCSLPTGAPIDSLWRNTSPTNHDGKTEIASEVATSIAVAVLRAAEDLRFSEFLT